jgi:hypothetical protein
LFSQKKIVKTYDAVVIVDDLATLFNSLHSIYTYARDVKKIVIAYDKKLFDKQDQITLSKMVQSCKNVILMPFVKKNKNVFSDFIQKYLSDYVLYLKSSQQLTQSIEIKKCCKWLSQTYADGWLFGDVVFPGKIQIAKDVYCCATYFNYRLYPKLIQKNLLCKQETIKLPFFLC